MNEVTATNEHRSLAGPAAKVPGVFLPDEKAAERFYGFSTANIRNKNTRRAYYKAACRFSEWCEGRGLLDLARVKPPHVAAYVEILGLTKPEGEGLSKPSVKHIWRRCACCLTGSWSAMCFKATRRMRCAARSIPRRRATRRCSTVRKRALSLPQLIPAHSPACATGR